MLGFEYFDNLGRNIQIVVGNMLNNGPSINIFYLYIVYLYSVECYTEKGL